MVYVPTIVGTSTSDVKEDESNALSERSESNGQDNFLPAGRRALPSARSGAH